MGVRIRSSLLVGLCFAVFLRLRDMNELFMWMLTSNTKILIYLCMTVLFALLILSLFSFLVQVKTKNYSRISLFVSLTVFGFCLLLIFQFAVTYNVFSPNGLIKNKNMHYQVINISSGSIFLDLIICTGCSLLSAIFANRFIIILGLLLLTGVYAMWLTAAYNLSPLLAIGLSVFLVITIYTTSRVITAPSQYRPHHRRATTDGY
jgi:hypothetical protein